MQNLLSRPIGKWTPDADEVGAPEGVLLRADNTVPDETGARALRAGSAPLYEGFQEQRVESLYGTEIDGVKHVIAGVDNKVYADGVSLGAEFDGDGDIAIGDDAYQVFAGRGGTRKKWDGENFHNWDIAAPALAPGVTAVDAVTETVATCDSGETPAFSADEGSKAFVANYAGTASSAMSITPDSATSRASVTKKFASDQDYFDILGTVGGNTDLCDMRVWFGNWRKVVKATIMFGLNTGTDPFLDDYYYFDFNIKDKGTVNVKDAASNAAAAFSIASNRALAVLSPDQVTNVRTPEEAGRILRQLGRFAGPRSTERRDALAASPAWGHLSVTRGQFNRVGGTSGRNWSTVRAFKIVYTVVEGYTDVMYVDDVIWTGGGSLSLTGNFEVGYRFARRFMDTNLNRIYYELSPMSPISDKVTLNQQALSITIQSSALAGKDAQVTEVWAYLRGGWLDTFYRFAILPAEVSTDMTIDEVSSPTGSNFNTPEKLARLTTWGFTNAPGAGSGSTDLVFTGGVSELEILIDNEPYTPGSMSVPDNIIAISRPWNRRTYLLDSQGWLHPSSGDSPSNYSAFHSRDLRKYGTPLWLANISTGIVVGFTKDVIKIAGTGDESSDRVFADIWADPLHVGNPPVDRSVMAEGNTIVYRSADGMAALSGGSLDPIPFAGTSLLWKGKDRHGVEALNRATGRFRIEVDNHILFSLMPEGSDTDPNAIWRYDFTQQEWSRHTYPFNPLSMFRDLRGRLLIGTDEGSIWEIETGSLDEDTEIAVNIDTPILNGGNPLIRKDALDFQIHGDTGGSLGTVAFVKDGAEDEATSLDFAMSGSREFRSELSGLGTFIQTKLSITGSFSTFLLRAFNITYRARPQQVMVFDPGYIIPQEDRDMAWLAEAEIDCDSPADLSLKIYRDDVLWDTLPVGVKPNVRSVYRVSMPLETKAKRLRLVVVTTNSAGEDNPGFEPWGMRVRHRGSGNFTELSFASGDAA